MYYTFTVKERYAEHFTFKKHIIYKNTGLLRKIYKIK